MLPPPMIFSVDLLPAERASTMKNKLYTNSQSWLSDLLDAIHGTDGDDWAGASNGGEGGNG